MADFLTNATKRQLPTLAQWIDRQNGGKRGDDYDAFEALASLCERTLATPDGGLPVGQACFLRLWKGFILATVELCNIEREKVDTPIDVIVSSLPRAMACAAVYAMASVAREDAPLRDIAKILTEEFRAAAKMAADDLMEKS
jgi:hypothetical protein